MAVMAAKTVVAVMTAKTVMTVSYPLRYRN
jgi:hypothetical protein